MDTQKAINSINYVCHCWPIGIASINAVYTHTERKNEFFASLKIRHIHKSYGTIWVIKNFSWFNWSLSLFVTKSIRIVVVQKYHDVVCVACSLENLFESLVINDYMCFPVINVKAILPFRVFRFFFCHDALLNHIFLVLWKIYAMLFVNETGTFHVIPSDMRYKMYAINSPEKNRTQ